MDQPRQAKWAHLKRMISHQLSGDKNYFFYFCTSFDRMFESVTLSIHLKNITMMDQAIQQCGCHTFTLEDLGGIKGEN